MATQVLQPSAALAIRVLSDNYDIPFHMVCMEGAATTGAPFQLVDTGVNFIESGVQVGMTVWSSSNEAAKITAVYADTLDIDADIFSSGGGYTIFSSDNPGCLIRIGTGKNEPMKVTTQGGDVVTFTNLNAGMILPVRISRVWFSDTVVSNLVALW
jgi:hypothetical protein